MVTCFITFDDLSGNSYPFAFLMFLNFFIRAVFMQSYYILSCIRSYHDNKLLQCHMIIQQSFMYTVCVLSYHTQNTIGGDCSNWTNPKHLHKQFTH